MKTLLKQIIVPTVAVFAVAFVLVYLFVMQVARSVIVSVPADSMRSQTRAADPAASTVKHELGKVSLGQVTILDNNSPNTCGCPFCCAA